MAELGSIGGTVAGGAETKVTIEMLDYDYVSKSSNVDELRAILTTLESGKEGKYSHLEEHVRQRIFKVAPGTRRIGQEPTPQERAEAVRDLEQWTKIEPAAFPKKSDRGSSVPIRGRRSAQVFASSKNEKKAPAKKRISGYDWDAWEKYEDSDSDDGGEAGKNEQQETLAERRSRARDERMVRLRSELATDDMSADARTYLAERERRKGNESFRAKDLEEAKFFYSKSLAYNDDDSRVYANRALVSLTMGNLEDAEADCDAALRLDPDYQKARARRGITRYKRGSYQRALEDFDMLRQSDSKIEKLKDLARQQVQGNDEKSKMSSHGDFVKITIRDEDDDEKEGNDAPQQEGARRIAIQIDEDSSDGGEDDEDIDTNESSQTPEHQERVARFDDEDDDAADRQILEQHSSSAQVDGDAENDTTLRRITIAVEEDDEDEGDDDVKGSLRRISISEDDGRALRRIPIAIDQNEDDDNNFNRIPVDDVGADEDDRALRRIPIAVDNSEDDRDLYRIPIVDVKSDEDDEEPPPLRQNARDEDTKRVEPVVQDTSCESKAIENETRDCEQEKKDISSEKDRERAVVNKERAAEAAKERGTQAMKRGELEEAVRLYSTSLEIFNTVAARNNRCLALLKLERWDEAIDDAQGVLDVEPRNVKALFRRGLAHRGNGNRTAALEDLSRLVSIEPDNKLAKKELERTKRIKTERQTLEFVDSPPPPPPPPPPGKKREEKAPSVVQPLPPSTEDLTTRLKAIDAAFKYSHADLPLPPPAKTTYEFEREWRNLSGNESRQAEYLRTFTPSQMRKVTKPTLDVFGEVLLRIASFQDTSKAAELLISASKAKSFGMMQAMLSKSHANAVLKVESDLISENNAMLATRLKSGYETLLAAHS